MKIAILAGGFGTRLSEETMVKPKPMVEIGGKPILWHILKIYEHYGFKEFVIALGYKGVAIKEYFLNYYMLNNDITVFLKDGTTKTKNEKNNEDWIIHLVDTGIQTNTGGRIRRLRDVIGNETFMATYGDGVADINLKELLSFHKKEGRIATVTAVRPPARFGEMILKENKVFKFTEKPQTGEGWINGGFFILEPEVFDYLEGDNTSLEKYALEKLAKDNQLSVHRHKGFWQCMDTLRDMRLLESLWQKRNPPWMVWRNVQ